MSDYVAVRRCEELGELLRSQWPGLYDKRDEVWSSFFGFEDRDGYPDYAYGNVSSVAEMADRYGVPVLAVETCLRLTQALIESTSGWRSERRGGGASRLARLAG